MRKTLFFFCGAAASTIIASPFDLASKGRKK